MNTQIQLLSSDPSFVLNTFAFNENQETGLMMSYPGCGVPLEGGFFLLLFDFTCINLCVRKNECDSLREEKNIEERTSSRDAFVHHLERSMKWIFPGAAFSFDNPVQKCFVFFLLLLQPLGESPVVAGRVWALLLVWFSWLYVLSVPVTCWSLALHPLSVPVASSLSTSPPPPSPLTAKPFQSADLLSSGLDGESHRESSSSLAEGRKPYEPSFDSGAISYLLQDF